MNIPFRPFIMFGPAALAMAWLLYHPFPRSLPPQDYSLAVLISIISYGVVGLIFLAERNPRPVDLMKGFMYSGAFFSVYTPVIVLLIHLGASFVQLFLAVGAGVAIYGVMFLINRFIDPHLEDVYRDENTPVN